MSCDIGLIGIAVMGENLVLNLESKGFKVAVFNRTSAFLVLLFLVFLSEGKIHFFFFFFFFFFSPLFCSASKVDEFVNGRGKGKNIVGCHDLASFAKALKLPRKAMVRGVFCRSHLCAATSFTLHLLPSFLLDHGQGWQAG
jgi:6-phosphogluconate dehydrogenase